jgi:hypothetical protein
MGMSNKNEKTEYDGLKIRPVFPQDKIDYHKAQTLGPTEEQLLTALYYDHSKWLEEMKTVCKHAGILLEQHLKKALGLAVEAGRVRNCNYDTGLKLRGPEHTGQDILLFFVKKCPHACEAILRGELPPYPWRISQAGAQKQNAPINVHMENVQAKNLQIGHDASIQEQQITEKKEKNIVGKILKIIGAIVGFLAALFTCLSYLLGWLEPIKAFIRHILWPK